MTPDELKLFDAVVSGQLDIFRLAASQRRKVLARLAKLEKELLERLALRDYGRGERRKLVTFVREVDEIVKKHFAEVQGELKFDLVAEAVVHDTNAALEIVLGPLDKGPRPPAADYYAAIASDAMVNGVPQAKWWARQSEGLTLAFEGQLRQGLASNETNQQLIQRIIGKNGVGGVMNVARHQAAALVQTSTSSVANTARRASFRSHSDLVIGLKQVSTLDGHTSDVCIAYSGACWDLDGNPIRGNKLAFNGGTPRHFNCRSLEVPILKSFRDLGLDVAEIGGGTRASDQGQIAANTTFDAFLKRKSQAYQDEVLGVGRADLWRSGKITLRDLVSGDGRPLTLKQLRQKAGLD